MAYIWYMSVNFGDDRAAADRFVEEYDGSEFQVPGETAFTIHLDHGVEDDHRNGWEVCVMPLVGLPGVKPAPGSFLNGTAGPADDLEASDLDAAAVVIYERLKKCIGYSWAMFNCEPGGWRSPKKLVEDLSPGGFLRERGLAGLEGLVISEALWNEAQQPEHFVRFCDGFMWCPWVGSMRGVWR